MNCRVLSCLIALFVVAARADGPADNIVDNVRPVPPKGATIPDAVHKELTRGADRLGAAIRELRFDGRAALPRRLPAEDKAVLELLPDVEIFHKAVDWALRHDEILNPTNEIPAARKLLEQGFQRLREAASGNASWASATGLVVRGYVSRLDDSIQPYGLVVPATYKAGSARPYRLDIWFHGRNERLTELNFLTERQKSLGEFAPPNTIVLHTYSRFCNGQKLAGEVDVFEALADVKRRYPIDENRIVVRGFSLGGAACWQIAAHYPGMWAAAAPGAGFAETPEFLKVFQREQVEPSWFEQKLWRQYNATDYALNFFNLPVVAYSGELDPQKQAADAMAAAMRAENLELMHIIGPKTRHSYHPAAKQEINRRIDSIAAQGRDPMPRQIRFTTWTLRYNNSAWLTIDALQRHWERARVEAVVAAGNSLHIDTENITALTIAMPAGLAPFERTVPVRYVIDKVEVQGPKVASDRSLETSFYKLGSRWVNGASPEKGLFKQRGLQGPIDDAFMASFLIVQPTGRSKNEKVSKWVAGELARATNEWRRHFRGDARVKDDIAINAEDIARHNLVIWGDLDSNHLMPRVLPKIPVTWTADQAGVGRRLFPAGNHVPLLIYPNPLNPSRYVVLNSSFTFREYDYLNNARQVPKLPDWAIIDINTPPSSRWPGKVVDAGFFGERWEIPK